MPNASARGRNAILVPLKNKRSNVADQEQEKTPVMLELIAVAHAAPSAPQVHSRKTNRI
jgi:hypothetical protein